MPVSKYTRSYHYSRGLDDVGSVPQPISGVLEPSGLLRHHRLPHAQQYSRSWRSASVPPLPVATAPLLANDVTNLVMSSRTGRYLPQVPYIPAETGRLQTKIIGLHDDEDDYVMTDARARRTRAMLEQLRRGDDDVIVASGNGPEVTSSSGSVRAELDSFARALSGVGLTTTGSGGGHATRAAERDVLPYAERLAMTRGDLRKLEGLVSRTFEGRSDDERVQRQQLQRMMLHRNDALSDDVQQIFIDESRPAAGSGVVDYTKNDSLASLAVRWAEERRRAVEREIEQQRYSDTADYSSPVDILTRSKRITQHNPSAAAATASSVYSYSGSTLRRRPDDYVILQSALDPHPVAKTTQTQRRSRQITEYELDDYDEPLLLPRQQPTAYTTRSFSATSVLRPTGGALLASSAAASGGWKHDTIPPQQSHKPYMSETRRKVRQLLCKSKGDPHYFDNRNTSKDEEY